MYSVELFAKTPVLVQELCRHCIGME